LHGLGEIALARGELQRAGRYLGQALEIASDISWMPAVLAILISAAELLQQSHQTERSVELLVLVLDQPAGDDETRRRAKLLLDRYQNELTADAVTTAWQRGQNNNLETVITAIQTELVIPGIELKAVLGPGPATRAAAGDEPPAVKQPVSPELVEQLTARELEVLQCIAQGLTNQQIAAKLIISVGTVKSYTSQIYGKLSVSNRTQAVARARELKLLV
jgi:ATP/maltotriose-dependent transcriptional regulator MalT